MKFYSQFIKLLTCSLLLAAVMPACKKGLDFENTNNINPDNVWSDPVMIKAFLSDIYGGLLPGWPFNGGSSDEGISTAKSLGNYQRGIVSVDATTSSLNYASIDKVNFFLDELAGIPASILPEDLNKQYTGEAKFWRAWSYWGMVSNVGGVPLILHKQDPKDVAGLFKPRNKTSECIAQIVKDLDSAILLLPGVYPGAGTDYGRITKVAAMAMKGRVLLNYASPLFNPANDQARWQAAYDACKAAVDYAVSQGHALHPDFKKIWTQERNKEVILVNQFFYPTHANNFNVVRPEPLTKDASNSNQPLLSLLLAFPKRDGSPLQFDKNMLNDAAYNTQFLTDFYTNRDDRFYATVFCGGTPYPTPDEVSPIYVKGNSFWNVWRFNAANNSYVNLLNVIHPGMPGNPGITGFFQRKGLDTTLIAGLSNQGQTDWVEMRFAELLLNYGECANELGKTAEALQVLKDIRARAGITAGINGNYGITGGTIAAIREAYITERQAEFAFENKRFGDLRRWKRYDILNSQGARHGLYITAKNAGDLPTPADNIMTASVRAKFTANYIDNLDGDDSFKFNLDLSHWFYAIPPSQISQSKNILEQNKEWGGNFDPLQ
ncbi:RagB/SusD family nutrient uptake outer membrane protein [Niabella pedocola]|uniref:RagB/SusD family nutrient uptake outer membrane protein n=1 Tax=Niabella pedocola TaxID=1752077 RepID=A0ABS8PPV1_9BACT|nr:RagB/SusD family nutrient uptake outer membrane protein [Niabella pedocola]MCD2421851.1 RagB/SusD family nutrient uptake outer membrane protein [Niabella pedocola]